VARLLVPVVVVLVAASTAGCASDARSTAATPSTTIPTARAPDATRPTSTVTVVPVPLATTAPVDVGAFRPPVPAGEPVALAAQISAAEGTIRNPQSSEGDLANAGLAQQVAYRQLGRHPEWDAAVAAALPAELRPTVAANAAARREFAAMHTKPSTTLPAWRIVEAAPAAELLGLYQEAEAAFHIPWPYLAAVNLVETGTGRIRGTSTAGAQGPMQFMPATWAAYGGGGDVNDTRDAIMGAARYLAANNGATDIDNALYRYNNSPHYVTGVKLYAGLIAEHPRAFLGYYHWGIWYLTDQGDVYLPVGYEESSPIPVADYRGP